MDRTTRSPFHRLRQSRLNPYSNGIWIEHIREFTSGASLFRLNPYSNGIWIELVNNYSWFTNQVLCLNPYSNGIWIEHKTFSRVPRVQ